MNDVSSSWSWEGVAFRGTNSADDSGRLVREQSLINYALRILLYVIRIRERRDKERWVNFDTKPSSEYDRSIDRSIGCAKRSLCYARNKNAVVI